MTADEALAAWKRQQLANAPRPTRQQQDTLRRLTTPQPVRRPA